MRVDRLSWVCVGLLILGASSAACSAKSTLSNEVLDAEGTSDPIVGGVRATDYHEAALIDSSAGFACSGAAIAPRVILTAGHCIERGSYNITLPFAGNQKLRSSGTAEVLDYHSGSDSVDPDAHDVGLIYLASDADLDTYGGFPTVATSPLADGSKGINVGRIQSGSFSSTALFKGAAVTMTDATSDGFPFDYISDEIIQSGDSGGPVYDASSTSHVIVAVNSGAGGGTQVLARTDLVFSWIDGKVKAHGGWGASGGGSSSSSGSSGTSSSSSSSGSSGTSSTSSGGSGPCVSEAEPNDTSSNANLLSCINGGLGSGDTTDWSTWTVDATGVSYTVALASSGDAALYMWKKADGETSWHAVTTTSKNAIASTSTAPGAYLVAVYSATGSSQTYTLTLTK